MRTIDYAAFVQSIDQSAGKPTQERLDIAIYGLAAEIGSLLSVVKKAILAEADDRALVAARKRKEVQEEVGDVLWYAVLLGKLANNDESFDVFKRDIINLENEISAGNDRAVRIELELTPDRKARFLDGAAVFLAEPNATLDDYQRLAFMTARTSGGVLERVCLAVLSQLGAEVLRTTLPRVELELNQKIVDRDLTIVLGEIVWHLAALSSLNELSFDEIANYNEIKVKLRYGRGEPTPLHDNEYPIHEQFPRRLSISFVSVGSGRSRMYFEGKPLGNELTDNSPEEDGYRFHDVMHLSILAKLGWSPVIRKLMGKKRKSSPRVDVVQDGARAQIVEELIIKSIHSEGTALLDKAHLRSAKPFFTNRGLISFSFLSQISRLADGLEAAENKLWEWEEAILEGSRLFQKLRVSGQGTVEIDLNARTIELDENVFVDLAGIIVGVGASVCDRGGAERAAESQLEQSASHPSTEGLSEALLDSLGLDPKAAGLRKQLDVKPMPGGALMVRAFSEVQERIWSRKAISFRFTRAAMEQADLYNVFAMADPRDNL